MGSEKPEITPAMLAPGAKCGHHGNLLHGKPCPDCFPDEDTGTAFHWKEKATRLQVMLREVLGYEIYGWGEFGNGANDVLTVGKAIEDDVPDLAKRILNELGE